jgi:hypothetical protein
VESQKLKLHRHDPFNGLSLGQTPALWLDHHWTLEMDGAGQTAV